MPVLPLCLGSEELGKISRIHASPHLFGKPFYDIVIVHKNKVMLFDLNGTLMTLMETVPCSLIKSMVQR